MLAVKQLSDVPAPEGADGDLLPACLARHLQWLHQRGLSSGTIYARQRAIIRLAAQLGCPPTTATPGQLADWYADVCARVDDDAQCGYLSHVNMFYAWAVDEGLIESNPAARLPYPKLGRRLPRPIAEERLMEAVLSAPARIRPWLVLAGWTGMRAKEIAYLRRRCVLDTARPPVILVASDATKGNRERVLPMSDFVLAELRPLLPASGWVFPRGDGEPGPNKPWTVSGLRNRHLHDLGFTDTLHSLRHRFGTITFDVVRDIRVTQELLGHASPATTAVYTAFSNVTAQAAVQQLPVPRRLRPVRNA